MRFTLPMKTAAACFAYACMLASPHAHAKLIEEQLQLPVSVANAYGKRIDQQITLTIFFDDETPSPRSALVLNHGRAVDAAGRAALGRARYPATAGWFAQRGFIVAVPTRIGYGVTGGEDIEDSGACDRKVYPPGFNAAAQETLAVLDLLRGRPDVQAQRMVAMGQSFGGGTTVALASLNPPGVVAAINFAGGAGGDPVGHPARPCRPAQLEQTFVDYGKTARVPMLWAYTENDKYFGPKYPRQWFEAVKAVSGAPIEFHQFGPHGDDGHLLFIKFPEAWQPVVADFLRRQGFTDFKD